MMTNKYNKTNRNRISLELESMRNRLIIIKKQYSNDLYHDEHSKLNTIIQRIEKLSKETKH